MIKLATKFAPCPTGFELAWNAGYRYAELWLDQNILQDIELTITLAQHYPFGYALHSPNQLDLTDDSLQNLVLLYRQIQASCLVIHDLQFSRYAERLLQIDSHLKLAVENHVFTTEQFNLWRNSFDFLTLDIEHLWLFTLHSASLPELVANVRDFLQTSGKKLQHIHLPGYSPGSVEHRPMYCSREMVFEMFSLLENFQFEGLIVSELELEFQNPQELLMDRLLFDRWRSLHERSALSKHLPTVNRGKADQSHEHSQ